MFRPQRGPQKVNGSAIPKQEINSQVHSGDENPEEEQLAKYYMRPNRSGPDLAMIERLASGITNENTPRYVGRSNYSDFEILPPLGREETNYTFNSTGSSSNIERQDTSSHVLNAASLRLAALQIQDNTSVDSWIASNRGNPSNASENALRNFSGIPSGSSTVNCDDRLVAGESSDSEHDRHSKTENTLTGEDLGTVDLGSIVSQVMSVPRFEELPSVPKDSQPEVPHEHVLDLSLYAAVMEDTCSEGSLMPDTDAESDAEWPVEESPTTARYSSEEQAMSTFPTYQSQWVAKFTTCPGRKGGASTSTTTSRSANDSTSTSSSSNRSHKHILGKGDDNPADGDGEPPVRPESDASGPQDVKSRYKFPCPFRKHDPVKYNPVDYHTCATTQWHSIDRLKEHLLRFHARRVKPRWRGASPREKWDRIYGFLFPNEAVRTPCGFAGADSYMLYFEHTLCQHSIIESKADLPLADSDYAPDNPLSPSQLRHTPGLEELFWHKLRCDLRTCLDRSANDCIKSLPDDAKAEIVKELVEECVLRLTRAKYSPNETPRMLAPPGQHQLGSQALSADEEAMETSNDNWDSSGGESSKQGLGLDFLTGPFNNTQSYFDEQYPTAGISDMSQSPPGDVWNGGDI